MSIADHASSARGPSPRSPRRTASTATSSMVNPMWAATEVRARVVDIHREIPDADARPVATITLQPTSTWRGHRAGQYVQVGVEIDGARRTTRVLLDLLGRSRARASGSRSRSARQRRGRRSASSWSTRPSPAQMLHLSQAEGDFTLPGARLRRPTTPAVDLRRLRHHPGDVDAPHAAARRVRRHARPQGHLPALRPQRPRTRSSPTSSPRSPRADNGIDVHLLHPERATSASAEFELARLVPGLPRHRHLGLRPGRR